MSVDIIRADLEQIDLILPLFDAYRVFYKQDSDRKSGRRFLEHRVKNGESVIFLALDGDNALGFVQLYPTFSSVSLKPLWILNDLFVAEAGRKRGVATALMTRAKRFAQETGAKGLVLQTQVNNAPAQALYDVMGWTRDDEFYSYFLNV